MKKSLAPILLAAVSLGLRAGPAAASQHPGSREVLPFIADDYPRALADARARALPIFVEAWAPW